MLLGGVVDQHVESTARLDRLGHRLLAELLLADIARDQDAAPAGIFDVLLRLFVVALLLQIVYRHVGALLSEGRGHPPADAAGPAGDPRAPSFQLPGGPFCGAAAPGPRPPFPL